MLNVFEWVELLILHAEELYWVFWSAWKIVLLSVRSEFLVILWRDFCSENLLIFFLWKGKEWKKLEKIWNFFCLKINFWQSSLHTVFLCFSFLLLFFKKFWILIFVEYFLELWWFWISVLFERGKLWSKKAENLFCCVFFEKCYSKINNIFKKLKNKNENLWKMKRGKCYL